MAIRLAVQEKMKERKKVKGWVAVRVEGDDYGMARKFMIPITHLYHPEFKKLLHKLEEIDGFCSEGPLSLPISVDDFLHLRWMVESECAHGFHMLKLCS